jgi:hypothetical protein
MNEVAKNGETELSEAERLAVAERFKAERAEKLKQSKAAKAEFTLADAEAKTSLLNLTKCDSKVVPLIAAKPKAKPKTEAPPIELLKHLANPERPKTETFKDADEEPKVEDEEEAFKAEAPPSTSELGTEEMKRRCIIRWKKLKEINRKSAVIRSFGGKCVIVTEGLSRDGSKIVYDFQSREAFDHWKANDFIPSLEKEKKSDAVGPWWWRHPKRRQYDGVVFKPRAPKVVLTPDGQHLFNTYLGWGVEPKQGDWSLIRNHIREVIANGDPKANDYIIRFQAWLYQHPDRRAEVALVLIGEKGTGKGTMGRWLEVICGHHSFQASSLDHIVGRFNAHKENCILFVADEAYWGGHKAAVGELQRMITEPRLPIERKGFDTYEAPNYIHMLMLAEPGWVIPAGRYERRYAAFGVSQAHMGDTAYFEALHHQIENGGAAAMLHDLLGMNLGKWHPRHVYKTAALRHQQELSLPPMDEWMLGLLEDGELPGALSVGKPQASTPTNLLNDLHSKVPRSRDLGKNKLADYLKEQWQCTKHGGVVGFYHFPPLIEMRTIWDKRYGSREWSVQADWIYSGRTPLGDLLDEKQ